VQANPLTQVVAPFSTVIRVYQRYIWLPGTVYGLILLLGAGGIVLDWRRLGGEALLPWTISLALIVIPAATAEFDYRYVLPRSRSPASRRSSPSAPAPRAAAWCGG